MSLVILTMNQVDMWDLPVAKHPTSTNKKKNRQKKQGGGYNGDFRLSRNCSTQGWPKIRTRRDNSSQSSTFRGGPKALALNTSKLLAA